MLASKGEFGMKKTAICEDCGKEVGYSLKGIDVPLSLRKKLRH